jgi:hypothetical protein
MAKLLLISILIATIVLPVRAARRQKPRRQLARTVRRALWFHVGYLLAAIYVYPRLFH